MYSVTSKATDQQSIQHCHAGRPRIAAAEHPTCLEWFAVLSDCKPASAFPQRILERTRHTLIIREKTIALQR